MTHRIKREALTPRQQKLVEEALPTAQALVRQTARLRGIHSEDELDEVDQTIGEVLCKAVTGYDEKRPTGFLNYAWKAIFLTAAQLIGSLLGARAIEVVVEGAYASARSTELRSEVEDTHEDDLRALEAGAEAFAFDLYIIDGIGDARLAEQIQAALGILKPEERQAFIARYLYDTKLDEIASMMGVDRSKVRRLISLARKKLRRFLVARGVRRPSE